MLIDVAYNTDLIDRYHCLTTTIYTSGDIEKNDVETIVNVMRNYLHHYNVIVVKHNVTDLFGTSFDDVLSVVKQAVKKAKQDWFKGVYCYKCEVVDDVILIYIGCNERFINLEFKAWEANCYVNESEFCDVR